jgi:hypothetical protein
LDSSTVRLPNDHYNYLVAKMAIITENKPYLSVDSDSLHQAEGLLSQEKSKIAVCTLMYITAQKKALHKLGLKRTHTKFSLSQQTFCVKASEELPFRFLSKSWGLCDSLAEVLTEWDKPIARAV